MQRYGILNPPPIGGGTPTPTAPIYTPGAFGLTTGARSLTTGLAGNKNGTPVSLGTLSSTIERLDVSARFAVAGNRVICLDIFAGATKIVTDLPFMVGSSAYAPPKPLNIHIASGSAMTFDAAANTNTTVVDLADFGYTATVTEPVTRIEPIGPVGSGATYTLTTGTLVKVPLGSAASGWVCINPSAATTNAYKCLYPFMGAYNDFVGRTAANIILELAYADDSSGTNLVGLGTQHLTGQAATLVYFNNTPNVPCSIPSGKYLFAKITLSTASTKSTGTVTDGDPFNVQVHGGR